MSELTKGLIFWVISFTILFIVYYFFILKSRYDAYNGKVKKKKNNKTKPLDFMEFSYLAQKFSLDKDKINVLYIFRWIAILNAFIIATTASIIYYIPLGTIWKFPIGFALVFALIYSLYELFGRHLVKKGWSKK